MSSVTLSIFGHAVATLEGNMMKGKTIGYLYCGATPAGIFSLSDACRTGVPEAVDELKSMRIKVAMLTGDNQAAAIHVQEQVHFDFSLSFIRKGWHDIHNSIMMTQGTSLKSCEQNL